jgi:DNA primase
VADNFAQLVKQQVDVARIVGEYVKLRKSGANWSALCPFHKEKSGSFYLYPATASYYCFGCKEHGDVFTFVMKMESVTFPEAVRTVATKMNIPLPAREFNSPEEARNAGIRKQLIDAHEAATQYFQQNLKSPEAARAREYLSSRQVTAETIERFRIGYAPESFNDMRDRLGKFFSEEVLRASGLFSSKEQEDGSAGPMYARFRKRITFPINNEQGKPIAFTARALDSADVDAKAGPKYLNSPETPLYTKGHVLFNLDKAKASIKDLGFVLLVEGQMDCISVFMSGVNNVLATSGTAFTGQQVGLLRRFTSNVVLNFDPDQAGDTATEKTIASLVEEGFNVKVYRLYDGLDPDRYIKEHGSKAYFDVVRRADKLSYFLINHARGLYAGRGPEDKVKALNLLLPHIRRVPNVYDRLQFADDAAQKLGIESALLRKELKDAAQQRLESVRAPQPAALTEVERIVICALIGKTGDPSRALAANQLSVHPEWYSELPSATVIEVLANSPAPNNPFDAASDETSRTQIASALHTSADHDQNADTFLIKLKGALSTLADRYANRRISELTRQIAEAERRGDETMVRSLIQEKFRLERERKR